MKKSITMVSVLALVVGLGGVVPSVMAASTIQYDFTYTAPPDVQKNGLFNYNVTPGANWVSPQQNQFQLADGGHVTVTIPSSGTTFVYQIIAYRTGATAAQCTATIAPFGGSAAMILTVQDDVKNTIPCSAVLPVLKGGNLTFMGSYPSNM